MEKKEVNYLIAAFVFLIVGIALIGAVASGVNVVTDRTNVADEFVDISSSKVGQLEGRVNESISNYTLINNPTGWKSIECPLAVFSIENATDDDYTLILGTDYELFNFEGIVRFLNSSTMNVTLGNNTYVTYTYCADGYLDSSWGRSVLNTVPGFFALALLGISLWLFYSVFASVGILKR